MKRLYILVAVGKILGSTSKVGFTLNEASLPSVISSCSGFNGSLADFPNSSSTIATTLPGLETRENDIL